MNEATAHLLFDAVERMEKNIIARECPAIVLLEGRGKLALNYYDYLRDVETAEEIENSAAEKALEIGAVRWVLAVPQVWLFKPPSTIAVRAVSNHALREGEQEAITWMSFDREDGVDYGRVAYVRRPNQEPVFEDPEIFDVGIRPAETMPGFALLQRFLTEE
ncbi:hypothetical protein [Nonomuraea sp. NPDC049607]|uniref:hypothetical protein n=1 Tax=Nonomuraea sp. NPDC049607 TaxID=3154732 RepID=UPI0034358A50